MPYLTRAYPEDLGILQKAYPRFPPILLVRHSQSKRTGENFSRRGDGKSFRNFRNISKARDRSWALT